jgi:hypothetical protein
MPRAIAPASWRRSGRTDGGGIETYMSEMTPPNDAAASLANARPAATPRAEPTAPTAADSVSRYPTMWRRGAPSAHSVASSPSRRTMAVLTVW